MVNATTRLPGLQGLAITDVVTTDEHPGQGPVVHLVTVDERARVCLGRGRRG